jgi:hypothetical protein
VSIVAKEISSTNEAIRFEVDRLREEHKLQPATATANPDVVESTSPANQVKVDSARSAFLYLTAMELVADTSIVKVIQTQLELYVPKHEFTISESEAAELSFTLENQIEKMPKLALYEDIVSKLNLLRTRLLQQKLTSLRTQMQTAEQNEDAAASLEHLIKIQEVQELLRKELLTVEIFGETG